VTADARLVRLSELFGPYLDEMLDKCDAADYPRERYLDGLCCLWFGSL
jgi:hypothetical protein